MTRIELSLPDQLAYQAERAGLLTTSRLEGWLREQLRLQQVSGLVAAMERMGTVGEPQEMSPEEIAQELAAMRAERRT